MSSGFQWTKCQAGVWQRIWSGPSPLGFVYMWVQNPPFNIQYQERSAAPPFFAQEGFGWAAGQQEKVLPVGPTPWVEIWVNPPQDMNMAVT